MTEPEPPTVWREDWTAPRKAWLAYKATAGLDHGVASWSSQHARDAFMAGWKACADNLTRSLAAVDACQPDSPSDRQQTDWNEHNAAEDSHVPF
jgi:hypothetical protein